jgi:DNA-binding LacI/PurR family transcriptional regulator
MSSSYLDPDHEFGLGGVFHRRRIRGIIVIRSQVDVDCLQMRDRFPLPVVLTNCRTFPYSVSTDVLAGARKAVEHSVQLGHRRIAYIANQRSNLDRLTSSQQVLSATGPLSCLTVKRSFVSACLSLA